MHDLNRIPEALFETLAYASNAFLAVMVLLLWGSVGGVVSAEPHLLIQGSALFGGLGALGVWAGQRLRARRDREDWIVQTELRLAGAAVVHAVRAERRELSPRLTRALREYDEARMVERDWRRGRGVPSERIAPKDEIED